VEAAAKTLELEISVLKASTSAEINSAFATLGRARPDALFIGGDAFFNTRLVQLATLSARYSLPSAFSWREFAEVGGLMTYGPNLAESYRQVGTYAGRVLRGEKPADLPVIQASKFELVINHETARMLEITVPPTLLSIADEVIE
jgi:putative ABC transport system substrate-binding protein